MSHSITLLLRIRKSHRCNCSYLGWVPCLDRFPRVMCCPSELASDSEKHALLQELDLMASLRPHSNVLQLLGFCREVGEYLKYSLISVRAFLPECCN